MGEKFEGGAEELSEEEYLKRRAKESAEREAHPEKFEDEGPSDEEIEEVKRDLKQKIEAEHRRRMI